MSASILKRIESRDLYKLVGESLISKEMRHKIRASDIAGCSKEGTLKPHELIVHPFRLDWGNGESYPLDNMSFFDQSNPEVLCTLPRHETSQYRPKQNFEWRVRVFVKDASKQQEAKVAFDRFVRQIGGVNPSSTQR